jgi:hypothetical protein
MPAATTTRVRELTAKFSLAYQSEFTIAKSPSQIKLES